VDDLRGHGVDDDRRAGRGRQMLRRLLILLLLRRSHGGLPDLVGVFADLERWRAGALELSPRRFTCREIGVHAGNDRIRSLEGEPMKGEMGKI